MRLKSRCQGRLIAAAVRLDGTAPVNSTRPDFQGKLGDDVDRITVLEQQVPTLLADALTHF